MWTHIRTFSPQNRNPLIRHLRFHGAYLLSLCLGNQSFVPPPLRSWKSAHSLFHYSMLDLGTNAHAAKKTESVITAMTCEAGLYMVNMNACTFLWLKLLIVELWVFARYIFSICVMFSLPLWMVSVYCELPLGNLLSDQISLTRWFLLACLINTFTYSILCWLGCVFLGASAAVNTDCDVWRSSPNFKYNLKQGKSQNITR